MQQRAVGGKRFDLVHVHRGGVDDAILQCPREVLYERARLVLGVPEEFAVEAMIAVGRPASVETLPEPLRERELPSGRKTVSEFAFPGAFGVQG